MKKSYIFAVFLFGTFGGTL